MALVWVFGRTLFNNQSHYPCQNISGFYKKRSRYTSTVCHFLPIQLEQVHTRRGKPSDTIGAAGQGARLELIVGDGGAFDGAPNEVAVQPVGQVAACSGRK